MDPYTDIEGFSHRSGSDFDAFHESINKSNGGTRTLLSTIESSNSL